MEKNKIIENSNFITKLQETNNVHTIIDKNILYIYTFIYNEEKQKLPTNMYKMVIKKDGNYIYDNFNNLVTIENKEDNNILINNIMENSDFIKNLQETNNVYTIIDKNKLYIYTFIYNEEKQKLPTNMYKMVIKKDGNYIYDNFNNLIAIENKKVKVKTK